MRDFFTSKTFISMCIITVILFGMVAVSAADAGRVTLIEDVTGIVITPIETFFTTLLSKGGNIAAVFGDHKALKAENEELKDTIAAASQALRDADGYRLENESYKSILGIKEQNPDFTFEQALVVADERGGYSHVLTLNKGSVDGIKKRDAVITKQGLVGYVADVGSTWCTVTTLLDASCEIGALVTRTQDICVCEGDYALAHDGQCRVSYLDNSVALNSGDSVVTSGIGGTFPDGLYIGNVVELKPEAHGISQYAVVSPAADFSALKNVFVITGFEPTAEEAPADAPEETK